MRELAHGLSSRSGAQGALVESYEVLIYKRRQRIQHVPTPSRLATDSAASSVQPPTKTARRRKSRHSSGERRFVAPGDCNTQLRCRAGASRVPPVSNGSRCSSTEKSRGGRDLRRAAASSIPSGSPSGGADISHSRGIFVGQGEIRAKRSSAITNKATAVSDERGEVAHFVGKEGMGRRGHRIFLLPSHS